MMVWAMNSFDHWNLVASSLMPVGIVKSLGQAPEHFALTASCDRTPRKAILGTDEPQRELQDVSTQLGQWRYL
jgi:hypothetical protein